MNRNEDGALDSRVSWARVQQAQQTASVFEAACPVPSERVSVRDARPRLTLPVRFAAMRFGGSHLPATRVDRLGSNGPAALATDTAARGARAIKRTFDIVCAGALLLVLSPLFAALALFIRATSGGPVLYRHPRIGKNGRRFHCFKFRTMVADAEEVLNAILDSDPHARREWEENFKLKDDPRILPIGRFLRRTSLDELPQLWNVLRGEMSLVGPRPIVAKEMKRYGRDIRCYLASVPGITGLWQISGRNDLSYPERVQLDRWYAMNWCLSLDFRILLRTIRAMVSGRGAY